MKILANENFPGAAVTVLREHGHDVFWVRTENPGASDRSILEQAQREERLIVTFDKDFGELAFRRHLPTQCGVVLLRIPMESPEMAAARIVSLLESRTDRAGHFSVIDTKRVRMTPLPRT